MGYAMSLAAIKRLRKRLNLRCSSQKRFVRTTDSRHTHPIATNVLAQRFDQARSAYSGASRYSNLVEAGTVFWFKSVRRSGPSRYGDSGRWECNRLCDWDAELGQIERFFPSL
jgi:hypothetical protein